MAEEEPVNWNVDLEVSLFHAIHAHRPVGINRHFQMIFLHDKLNSAVDKKVSSKEIWNHLREMYDLAALNDSDGLPFPNKESDFALPEDVIDELTDKSFPRYTVTVETKTADAENKRDSIKDNVVTSDTSVNKDAESKASTSSSRTAKAAASQATEPTAKSEDTVKGSAVDSPKPDPRKRTRHSLQSPQTESATTPSSAKRTRRI